MHLFQHRPLKAVRQPCFVASFPCLTLCGLLHFIVSCSWSVFDSWARDSAVLSGSGQENYLGTCECWSRGGWAGGCFWVVTQCVSSHNVPGSGYPQFLINFTGVRHPQHQAGLALRNLAPNNIPMFWHPLMFEIHVLNATFNRNGAVKINRTRYWSHSPHSLCYPVWVSKEFIAWLTGWHPKLLCKQLSICT